MKPGRLLVSSVGLWALCASSATFENESLGAGRLYPTWVGECAAFLSRQSQAWKVAGWSSPWGIQSLENAQISTHPDCARTLSLERVGLDLVDAAGNSVQIEIKAGAVIASWNLPDTDWRDARFIGVDSEMVEHTWTRSSSGRSAQVHMTTKVAHELTGVASAQKMREAIDACIGLPSVRYTNADVDSVLSCSALRSDIQVECTKANLAFEFIEAQCQYGRRLPDVVRQILKLGSLGRPLLVRLAHSKNPVSRMAAITGFRMQRSREGDAEIARLANDREFATVFKIDVGYDRTVGEAAREALKDIRSSGGM